MKIDADQLLDIFHRTICLAVKANTPDLSARQLAIILSITLDPGMHTVRGLALKLNISKPAISRSLDRLYDLGLAGREPDPRDRRSVLVVPTAAGVAHVAELRSMLLLAARQLPVRRPIRRSQPISMAEMVVA